MKAEHTIALIVEAHRESLDVCLLQEARYYLLLGGRLALRWLPKSKDAFEGARDAELLLHHKQEGVLQESSDGAHVDHVASNEGTDSTRAELDEQRLGRRASARALP